MSLHLEPGKALATWLACAAAALVGVPLLLRVGGGPVDSSYAVLGQAAGATAGLAGGLLLRSLPPLARSGFLLTGVSLGIGSLTSLLPGRLPSWFGSLGGVLAALGGLCLIVWAIRALGGRARAA